MIYFDFYHLRIYIDLNERVFIIITDVIDTVLGLLHMQENMVNLGLISMMYSALSIACGNFIVFHFYIVIQLCSSIVVYLYSYYSCNLHSCIINYTMYLYSYCFLFIQLFSLYSYAVYTVIVLNK